MSAEQAIYRAWTGYKPLADLIPAERVFVGQRPGGGVDFPYVVFMRTAETEQRTSSNTIKTATIVMTVQHNNYDDALAILRKAESYFDRGILTYPGGKVLDMRPQTGRQAKSPDGTWTLQIDWKVITAEAKVAYPVGA